MIMARAEPGLDDCSGIVGIPPKRSIREIYPTLTARRLRPSVLRPKSSICSFFAALWIIQLTLSNSFVFGLMLGKRHIADVNQNIAEPHAAITAPASMNDLIITPNGSGMDRDYTAN
jgi:hypothetical protein